MENTGRILPKGIAVARGRDAVPSPPRTAIGGAARQASRLKYLDFLRDTRSHVTPICTLAL